MTAFTSQSGGPRLTDDLRDRILAEPEVLLGDKAVMRALVGAHERGMGGNIVDLRGAAMRRLEGRLDRLEETHRSVIAAAYENLAGTNLIHRAVLQLMAPTDFAGFLAVIGGQVADTLRLDSLRLVLEARVPEPALAPFAQSIHIASPGFIDGYLALAPDLQRPVTLRSCPEGAGVVHGRPEGHIRSEALLLLDLGPGRLPGLLAMGSSEDEQFGPRQATDLLRFFGNAFALSLQRWLA